MKAATRESAARTKTMGRANTRSKGETTLQNHSEDIGLAHNSFVFGLASSCSVILWQSLGSSSSTASKLQVCNYVACDGCSRTISSCTGSFSALPLALSVQYLPCVPKNLIFLSKSVIPFTVDKGAHNQSVFQAVQHSVTIDRAI